MQLYHNLPQNSTRRGNFIFIYIKIFLKGCFTRVTSIDFCFVLLYNYLYMDETDLYPKYYGGLI